MEMTIRDLAIFRAIEAERNRQDEKWGANRQHDAYRWFGILAEEHGEVSKAILEIDFDSETANHLREELVQVAAVAVAFIDCLDRNGGAILPPKTIRRIAEYQTPVID